MNNNITPEESEKININQLIINQIINIFKSDIGSSISFDYSYNGHGEPLKSFSTILKRVLFTEKGLALEVKVQEINKKPANPAEKNCRFLLTKIKKIDSDNPDLLTKLAGAQKLSIEQFLETASIAYGNGKK